MHERFRSLITHIYAAAADDSRWERTLEHLGDTFGGGVPGLQYQTGPEGHVRWGRFARVDPGISIQAVQHYATRNPWTRASQPLWRPGRVIATHHLVPVTELRRTSYYDGILRPAGVENGFGACLLRNGDNMLGFTVIRSRARGPYERHEMKDVRVLLPHLLRAVQVSQQLAALERSRDVLGDGLERLQQGVFLVGPSGRIIFANRAARDLVAEQDGLAITGDGLTAASHTERLALRAMIDQAVQTSKGEGDRSGGAMAVSRPSLKQPYNVLVAPLTLDAGTSVESLATVFVVDPERTLRISEGVLQGMYALSRTETRLAQAIAETGNLERAADQLRITRGTARWHLKRIYRKTATHHQAGLVARLLRGTARVAMEEA